MPLLTDGRNSRIISAVNFISSKFGIFPQGVLKVVLHTGLNVYIESSGGSRFVTHSLLVWYSHKQDLLHAPIWFSLYITFIKVCPIPIQNNMRCWWIEVKKSPKYKLNYNIGDLLKTTFWYHSNNTKRNPWVMLCSHCPINDSSRCLHITVYMAVMLQASSHTTKGN